MRVCEAVYEDELVRVGVLEDVLVTVEELVPLAVRVFVPE